MFNLGLKKLVGVRSIATLLFSLLLVFALSSCGGGKDKKVADEGDVSIDQLLGIESEQPQEKDKQKNPDEDEVLRLLGISPEEQKPAEQAQQAEAPTPDIEALRAEVQKLENELSEKEKLIQDLRRDLEEKDQRLEALQAQKTAMKSARPIGSTSAAAPATGSFRDRYRAALSLYNAKRYREAIDAFSALLAENPNNSLADNCQYWIGEAYYGLGNYAQAIAEFEKVFAYANSNKADAALLKLGITYLKLGDRESARAQFEQLIATYPKSEYVRMAQSYLNRLQ